MDIGVGLHSKTVRKLHRLSSLFHLLLFRFHAEAFVEVCMKHLYPLPVQLANQLFTLLICAGLLGIEPMAATTHHEDVRLMEPAGIDQAVVHPVPLNFGRKCGYRPLTCGDSWSSRRRDHSSQETSAIHLHRLFSLNREPVSLILHAGWEDIHELGRRLVVQIDGGVPVCL